MSKDDYIEMKGEVVDAMRNAQYKVKLPNGHVITAYVCGKMHLTNTRVNVGDQVTVEISPYDLTKGRIRWNNSIRSYNPPSNSN